MAKPNYEYAKRQRELAKKKKKEDKQKRKNEQPGAPEEGSATLPHSGEGAESSG